MAVVNHLELESCHSGPPTKSTTLFGCPLKFGVDPIIQSEILRFYDFASLACKCLTIRPVFESFFFGGGLYFLKLWVVTNTTKGTSLGEDASFKP